MQQLYSADTLQWYDVTETPFVITTTLTQIAQRDYDRVYIGFYGAGNNRVSISTNANGQVANCIQTTTNGQAIEFTADRNAGLVAADWFALQAMPIPFPNPVVVVFEVFLRRKPWCLPKTSGNSSSRLALPQLRSLVQRMTGLD